MIIIIISASVSACALCTLKMMVHVKVLMSNFCQNKDRKKEIGFTTGHCGVEIHSTIKVA